jgi:hypothetical protein
MSPSYYCYGCEAAKVLEDLHQVTVDETCLYTCRQYGAVEGVLLQVRPAPSLYVVLTDPPSQEDTP